MVDTAANQLSLVNFLCINCRHEFPEQNPPKHKNTVETNKDSRKHISPHMGKIQEELCSDVIFRMDSMMHTS